MSGSDDVRLTVEIVVASSQVGRIIGKGGQNVRELQRVTGSLIKLPEQPQQPPGQLQEHDTTVHIVGPFYSVQVWKFTTFVFGAPLMVITIIVLIKLSYIITLVNISFY